MNNDWTPTAYLTHEHVTRLAHNYSEQAEHSHKLGHKYYVQPMVVAMQKTDCTDISGTASSVISVH